jgi:hypothetical protein
VRAIEKPTRPAAAIEIGCPNLANIMLFMDLLVPAIGSVPQAAQDEGRVDPGAGST